MRWSILTLPGTKQRWRRQTALLILTAVGVLLGLALIRFAPSSWRRDIVPASSQPKAVSTPKAVSRPNERPAPIDFGNLVAGGKAQKQVRLQPSFEPLARVARVATSCPCLSVTLLEPSIPTSGDPASGMIDALFSIDLSTEPGFSGGLAPEARFLDADDCELVCIEVNVNVLKDTPPQGEDEGIDK